VKRETTWLRGLQILCACLALANSAPALAAGYKFSISASGTDPLQNSSAATNGVRDVYLWATCIEPGLSAFEAGLQTTLTVYGFTPLNGTMNVGTSTDIMLAVGGCPFGSSVNFLLGKWTVLDTGGTLCLDVSPSSGMIRTVDCATNPTETVNPKVSGFSSNGTSPCSVGSGTCPSGGGGGSGSFGT
jgi:hypothetical protein